MKPINGMVVKAPWPDCREFVIVFLNGGYGLLAILEHRDKLLSCPMFQTDENGKWIYTESEIEEKTKHFEIQKKRLDLNDAA